MNRTASTENLNTPKVEKFYNILDSDQFKLFGQMIWKRLSQVYPEQKFKADIYDAESFVRGTIGNTYFLAVLKTVSKNQKLIDSFFSTKEINSAGIYVVYFYINGIAT
jgi:hypothetical protein